MVLRWLYGIGCLALGYKLSMTMDLVVIDSEAGDGVCVVVVINKVTKVSGVGTWD